MLISLLSVASELLVLIDVSAISQNTITLSTTLLDIEADLIDELQIIIYYYRVLCNRIEHNHILVLSVECPSHLLCFSLLN